MSFNLNEQYGRVQLFNADRFIRLFRKDFGSTTGKQNMCPRDAQQ